MCVNSRIYKYNNMMMIIKIVMTIVMTYHSKNSNDNSNDIPQ